MSDEVVITEETQEETQEEEVTFDSMWEGFVSQLTEARERVEAKGKELEAATASMTRVDLTEYNGLKTMVTKLEAALETMDLIRTKILKEESKITFT